LLNLGMKSWDSAFNAQGSRVIIVVVQVRAVKIYVAVVYWRRWELSTGYYQMLLLVGDLISCSSILCCKSSVDLRWCCYAYSKRPTPWVFQTSFLKVVFGCLCSDLTMMDHGYLCHCNIIFTVILPLSVT
jgi:hypothetical protein